MWTKRDANSKSSLRTPAKFERGTLRYPDLVEHSSRYTRDDGFRKAAASAQMRKSHRVDSLNAGD